MRTPAIFNVAIYLRLSKEDGDNEESDSIGNQRELILNYISKYPNLKIYNEHIDDGYTGTNFNRPGFKRMIDDIESKKVNMVITKNLSRFGREYIETGWYIEKYFPDNMIRYVAILDKVDNFIENVEADFIPMKSVFNEKFCRETSISVKRSKRKKMQEGFYSCTTPPFGYKKDPNEKGKLIIDETTSKIVRKIFDLKLSGYSSSEIVDYLDENNVITPLEYQDMTLNKLDKSNRNKYVWRRSSINRILCNKVYLGDSILGKTQKVSYKSKMKIHIRRDDCVTIKHTHTPIVTEEEFYKIHDTDKYGAVKTKFITPYKLKGLLFCAECGKSLTIHSNAVVCRSHEDNKRLCSSDFRVNYLKLENEVLSNLKDMYNKYFEKYEAEGNIYKIQTESILSKLEKQLNQKFYENNKNNKKISTIYNKRLSDEITDYEYKELYNNLTNKRNELNKQIEEKKNEINKVKDQITMIENKKMIFEQIDCFDNSDFSQEDIQKLVKRIEISNQNSRIFYSFCDPQKIVL